MQQSLWFQMWARLRCIFRNVQWPVCWFQPYSILGSGVSSVLDNVSIVTDGSICIHQWRDLAVGHGCNTMMLFTANKKAMQKLCSRQAFTVLHKGGLKTTVCISRTLLLTTTTGSNRNYSYSISSQFNLNTESISVDYMHIFYSVIMLWTLKLMIYFLALSMSRGVLWPWLTSCIAISSVHT